MSRTQLLDLNVLIALAEPLHVHYGRAHAWFSSSGKSDWALCPLTEAGFLRTTTNPAFRPVARSMQQAKMILQVVRQMPGYSYWGMEESWISLTAPFTKRVSGHLQVTDAYLLGLAIKKNGVLVTFDKGIATMAGPEFRRNVLVLE